MSWKICARGFRFPLCSGAGARGRRGNRGIEAGVVENAVVAQTRHTEKVKAVIVRVDDHGGGALGCGGKVELGRGVAHLFQVAVTADGLEQIGVARHPVGVDIRRAAVRIVVIRLRVPHILKHLEFC